MTDFIATLVERSMTSVFEDWQMMIDVEFSIVGTRRVDVDGTLFVSSALGRPTIVIETMVEGHCEGPLFIGFTESMVANIVGPMIALSAEVIADKEDSGLDDGDLEAFQEMASLLCDSSNKVFQEFGRELRVSQSADHLKLHRSRGGSEETFLTGFPAGELCCVQVLVETGGRRFPLLLGMSEELAGSIADEFLAKG